MIPSFSEKSSVTQVRLRLHIPPCYHQEPVISQLISTHSLTLNITGAMLGENTDGHGCFDLELQGSVAEIDRGLTYLESLNIKILGKLNADGDAWWY
ncbi:MAG: NIL domain-containing protein [Rhizonema sp. NSF051]|nr:NIL domain-containing protein [Rhizonema sp. NSF051]